VQGARGSGQSLRSGQVDVASGEVTEPPGIYVAGDRIAGRNSANPALRGQAGRQLAAAASAPLVGGSGPVATVSPDGTIAAYNTWAWVRDIDWFKALEDQGIASGDPLAMPTVHLLTLEGGADVALEPGSFSVAWRSDGALAYARGTQPEYRWNVSYLRDVVVRDAPSSPPSVWTRSPGLYRVAAWAGSSLVVEREEPGAPSELVVFDRPGKSRTLATSAELLAVAPDGRSAVVAQSRSAWADPAIELVRISDGAALASLPSSAIVDPVTGAPIEWIAGPGDWEGARIVASAATGLVVLAVDDTTLEVEQVLHVDSALQPNGILYEPRFVDESRRTIVAWADVSTPRGKPWHSAQLQCDRVALTCRQGSAVPAKDVPRPVYNRSGGR
jgi:hypothetical protein